MFSRYFGLILFLSALLLRFAFMIFPDFFEAVYFERVFPGIRHILAPVGATLPFAGYFALVLIALVWLVWRLPKQLKNGRAWLQFGRRLLNFIGGLAAFFLIFWGYLYVGRDLSSRMDLSETETTYDVAELYLSTMKEAEWLRQFVNLASDTSAVEDLEVVADSIVYEAMSRLLEPLGYPVEPPVFVRRVIPAGTLRRLGISGIYNPFTGEANIEPSSGALSGTFTMAHEMAHAMGVTREGEANFAAYLALRRSNEPLLRYSAAYFLWRYVASDVRDLLSEEDQMKLASAIPEELMIDRRAIWRRAARHEPVFPELSERLNDQYLKLQGVRAGTDDYNAFVGLYLSYRESIRE